MNWFVRWADALASLIVVGWFFLPVTAVEGRPATGPDLVSLLGQGPWQTEAFWMPVTWLLPLYPIFRWVAVCFPRAEWARPGGWSATLSRLVASGVLVASLVLPVLLWGDRDSWFLRLPATSPLLLALGLVLVLWSTVDLLQLLARRDPLSKRYQEFLETETRPLRAAFERLSRIRSKLLAAFMGLIAVVVVSLSTVLLSNYERSLIKAVADGARSQVLQATSVYKANMGDTAEIAMFDFINAQNRVNAQAATPFRSFSFHTDLQSRYWVDQPDRAPFPTLPTEYTSELPDTRYPPGEALASAVAQSLLGDGGAGRREGGTISWGAPVVVNEFETVSGERVRHQRLIGMAVLTFELEDILAPYVQTRSTVIVLTLGFLYLAGILVYLVGTFIVTPLLHLRMNVREVSLSLQTMVRGEGRISASNLRFDQVVKTKDEIQHLSGEIGNMVTVIKGIIPYISASTLRQAETGAALSQSKELTFLFTDIRGFTTLCEGMAPQEVVTLLNRYLDLETEIIVANDGDVDKFVGDEVMAFFDGPDQKANACRAALQIRRAMDQETAHRKERGLPVVDIGIGIHSGTVVFGSVGARDRMDFTSIGDPVNLAARLEGANKAYQSRIILSEVVYRQVAGDFVCRELDFIAVKGKNEPVGIYELFQETQGAPDQARVLARAFEAALAAYRNQDWAKAEVGFGALKDHDGPSQVFFDRVRRFREVPPPPGWDGVYRMETK